MKFLEIAGEILILILLLCTGVVQKKARAKYGTEAMSRKRSFAFFGSIGVAVGALVALTSIVIDVMPVIKKLSTTDEKGAAIVIVLIYAVGAAVAVAVFCIMAGKARRIAREFSSNYDRAEAPKMLLLLFCTGAWAWFRLSWMWVFVVIGLLTGKGISLVFED